MAFPAGPSAPPRTSYRLTQVSVVAAFAIFLVLALALVTILAVNARIATWQGVVSAFDLASDFADVHRGELATGPDPMMAAVALVSQLDRLRDIRADIVDDRGNTYFELPASSQSHPAPPWFVWIVGGRELVSEIPITKYPKVEGYLRIMGDYRDKSEELWRDFSNILPTIAVTCVLAVATSCAVVLMIVQRIRECEAALHEIRAGQLSVRLPARSIREFAELADGINSLAEHLASQHAENERLQLRLMTLTERERQQIASDLHDGMGPYLFALGAALSEAHSLCEGIRSPVRDRLKTALCSIDNHLRHLRKATRMVIYHLRPLILPGTDLGDLLNEFAVEFQQVAPGVRVSVDVEPSVAREFQDRVDLVVYRFVQESALNAVRHGNASVIAISVWSETAPKPELVVRLSDNGSGPRAGAAPHHGQTGILDRVNAMGGCYMPPVLAEEGTRTEIRIPC